MAWHYVVIEIEKTLHYGKRTGKNYGRSGAMIPRDQLSEDLLAEVEPCWNILYKAPIGDTHEIIAFEGCQVWIEQNKAPGSRYAIVKMYLV